jgi:hypothetical protein
MDYGKVLGRAWQITWRWKMLWVLGFLAALGQGGGGNLPQYNYTFNEQDFERWGWQFNQPFDEFFTGVALLTLGICCALVIIVVILWVVSLIARGGLIAAVQQVEQDGETSFGKAWSAGARKFWTLFGLGILAALPVILLVVFSAILFGIGIAAGVNLLEVGEALGITSLLFVTVTCGGFLCCGLFFLTIALEQIRIYGERAAMLEDLDWIAAFKRGWQVLVENLGATLILWLIFFALGIVIFGVTFVIMLALSVPFLGLFVNADPNWTLFGPLCVGTAIGAIIYAVIRSIIVAFTSGTWTLAFMELTKGDEHPQLGNLELIEEA